MSDRALCAIACFLAEGDIVDQPDEGYWLDEAGRYLAALTAAGLRVVECEPAPSDPSLSDAIPTDESSTLVPNSTPSDES